MVPAGGKVCFTHSRRVLLTWNNGSSGTHHTTRKAGQVPVATVTATARPYRVREVAFSLRAELCQKERTRETAKARWKRGETSLASSLRHI